MLKIYIFAIIQKYLIKEFIIRPPCRVFNRLHEGLKLHFLLSASIFAYQNTERKIKQFWKPKNIKPRSTNICIITLRQNMHKRYMHSSPSKHLAFFQIAIRSHPPRVFFRPRLWTFWCLGKCFWSLAFVSTSPLISPLCLLNLHGPEVWILISAVPLTSSHFHNYTFETCPFRHVL